MKRSSFLPAFLVVVFLCIAILVLSVSGKLKFLSFLEKPASGIQSFSYNLFQKLPFVSQDSRIKILKEDNLNLLGKIADYERLKRENAALSDQFQTSYPSSVQLLQAQIIGAPGFIPGVSAPDTLILNKGAGDNIKEGSAVVIKNNLIGIIAKVSGNLSKVNTISNPSFSFTAKTQNAAVGIIKGGESLTLDNILLSENISKGELVLTKGNVNNDGAGIPPDLVVGKITSLEKNPSDLFQKASVESFIDLTNLTSVFVYMQNNSSL